MRKGDAVNDLRFVNILETDRVIREKVRWWRNKQDVRSCMLSQSIISQEEHAQWLAGLSKGSVNKFWVIFWRDVPIGAAYLQNIDYDRSTSEWGFYIGEEAYKGRGVGKKILFNLLEKVFDKMAIEFLFTKVLSTNGSAIHLYKKFYFSEKSRLLLEDGREVIIFEFARSAWLEVKDELEKICGEMVNKSVEQ